MLSILVRILGYIGRILSLPRQQIPRVLENDTLSVYALENQDQYSDYRDSGPEFEGYLNRRSIEKLEQKHLPLFSTRGTCAVCASRRKFYTDYRYAISDNNAKVPNWRERMICLRCLLNNRQRASYHLFMRYCQPSSDSRIYITEQHTSYYRMLKARFPATTGSEYFGDKVPLGTHDKKGRRNENLCRLTFEDGSFDVVLTYDVLEHVPDYKLAISEIRRVLSPGGYLMVSVPFNPVSASNIVRAMVNSDGSIQHILEPEYHGNPISRKGSLCFYHFGWELLDDLRNSGFIDVRALFYWSRKYGYLGGEQIMVLARNPA